MIIITIIKFIIKDYTTILIHFFVKQLLALSVNKIKKILTWLIFTHSKIHTKDLTF